MELRSSNISCGVMELTNVGYRDDYKHMYRLDGATTMGQAYKSVMGNIKGRCSMVIASLTVGQKAAKNLLIDNGFKQVGKPKRNPNSGNRIILLVKRV